MKSLVWHLILFVALTCAAAVPTWAQTANLPVGNWVYRFSDREGVPSKCDCDYREEVIALSPNGTFQYKWQRGRLDPKWELEKGTWEMRNDSVVRLTTTHKRGSLWPSLGATTDPDQWQDAPNHHEFVVSADGHGLHEWSGGKEYQYSTWQK